MGRYNQVIPFIITISIGVPIFVVLVPTVIAYKALEFIVSKTTSSLRGSLGEHGGCGDVDLYPPIDCSSLRRPSLKELQQREFDLILFGATGFTGNLACKYLQKQYGSSIKWAIAGRRKDSLEKIKKELKADIPIIVADSNDLDSMMAMSKRGKQNYY